VHGLWDEMHLSSLGKKIKRYITSINLKRDIFSLFVIMGAKSYSDQMRIF
jgi:hypothetical protein